MCVLLVLSLPCIVASTYEEFSRLGIGTVEYYVHNLKLSLQTKQPEIQSLRHQQIQCIVKMEAYAEPNSNYTFGHATRHDQNGNRL